MIVLSIEFSRHSLDIFDKYKSWLNALDDLKKLENLNQLETTFDLSQFTQGVYFLKVESTDGYQVMKIVKE